MIAEVFEYIKRRVQAEVKHPVSGEPIYERNPHLVIYQHPTIQGVEAIARQGYPVCVIVLETVTYKPQMGWESTDKRKIREFTLRFVVSFYFAVPEPYITAFFNMIERIFMHHRIVIDESGEKHMLEQQLTDIRVVEDIKDDILRGLRVVASLQFTGLQTLDVSYPAIKKIVWEGTKVEGG